jgi:glycosyltransferase involved in cell wall biosynthesis
MQEKYKVLMLSDHALSTSGVGCQSRFLIEGLIEKGCWTVRQFGAAIKHADYDTVVVSDDFIIKPIDGFGSRELILQTLAIEKPDVILLFTDPRFFIWLWEMEDEIHDVCPIAYWHVWDNYPRPDFNDVLYEATDLINCHSHMTYEQVASVFPEKTNFIPHSLPEQLFYQLPESEKQQHKLSLLGPERRDDFVVFWVNRNARRKRPNDVLWAFSKFVDLVKEKHGKTDVTLLMHTDPHDQEGPNLVATAEHLGINDRVVFSTQRVDFPQMNVLHNISDACINMSYAEGFGLATLEAMQCGNPIISIKTGGLTRQVVDHRDGTENGVALDVEFQSMVGSQQVPYIYEDYCSITAAADAMLKIYDMNDGERKALSEKVLSYVDTEFKHQDTIDAWHETLLKLVDTWKTNKPPQWSCSEVKLT